MSDTGNPWQRYAITGRWFEEVMTADDTTRICPCGSRFTWSGFDEALAPWMSEHEPHGRPSANQSAQDLDQLDRDAQMRAATAAIQAAVAYLDQTLAVCASVSDEARAWATDVALGYGQRLIRFAEENGRGNG